MNISGLDRARILKALYDHSRPVGMGCLTAKPGPMPLEEARALISAAEVQRAGARTNLHFDYVYGRPLKVVLGGSTIDLRLYDRDHGEGAGELAILEEFTKPEGVGP